MLNIFEVKDPRGRVIFCSKDIWEHHILIYHPAMSGQEKRIEQTIHAPKCIYQAHVRQNREIFYSLPKGKKYVLVVVEFADSNVGNVVTAFYSDSIKPKDRLIWPQPKTT